MTSYCVSATVGGRTAYQAGPGAPVTTGAYPRQRVRGGDPRRTVAASSRLPRASASLFWRSARSGTHSAESVIRGLIVHVTLAHALALLAAVALLIVVVGVTPSNRWRLPQSVSGRARRVVELRDGAGALVDGVPWQAAVSVIAVLLGIGWFAIGHTRTLPGIFADELIRIELARDLANNGTVATHGYGIVSAAIDAIAFRLTSHGTAAYHLIQVFNVAIMVSAAFPAYLLSRRALSHRWSLAVAAMTVAVPWMRYSAFVMTEPAFYPFFCFFLSF